MTRTQRAAARAVALLGLLAACAGTGAAAAPPRTLSDAYSVATPGKPWVRRAGFEVAGERTWTARGERGSQALLRVACAGVAPGEAAHALEGVLARARAEIRADVDGRPEVERSGFEADSIVGQGGLRWIGFRVSVRAGGQLGTAWRFVALHPGFPARRLAYTVAYDETAPSGTSSSGGEAAARTLAASLAPLGRGLAGGIDEAWLEARAAAFAAVIDSAQKLCWSERPDASPGFERLGMGVGLVHGGDFYLLGSVVPRDSLVDAAAVEYGAAFDRNGDGRPDLLVVNRGLQSFGDKTRQPTVTVCGDDDFDGRVDALLVEDADRDGDGHIDARILVHDRNGDGLPDEAHAFVDSAAPGAKGTMRLAIESGRVQVRRIGALTGSTDFGELFRSGGARLAELARAHAACAHR